MQAHVYYCVPRHHARKQFSKFNIFLNLLLENIKTTSSQFGDQTRFLADITYIYILLAQQEHSNALNTVVQSDGRLWQ